ncbi:MAG TPA: PDZ domain-containing protein [Pirellulales bacterium]|nr:PDZ domain-containing protein [Pirellulales bacterium]
MRSYYENWLLKAAGATLAVAVLCWGGALHAQQPGGPARYLPVDQTGEKPEQPVAFWIGVACEPLPEALRSQLGLPKGQGVLVQDVVEGSPAAQAGLKRYDVVLALGDQGIGSAQELSQAVKQTRGKEASVRYLRSGKEATVTVKPAARPARTEVEDPWFVPEGDQASLQNWLRRLGPGGPATPLGMRFFHPGMVLPPGAPADISLPDDVSVTISKQGKEPAKISVRQGDRSWEVAEGKLDELPDEVRLPIERMLGGPRFDINVLEEGQPAAKRTREAWPGVRNNRRAEASRPEDRDRLDRQLDEIREQLRQLQKAMDNLQSKNGAGKQE